MIKKKKCKLTKKDKKEGYKNKKNAINKSVSNKL